MSKKDLTAIIGNWRYYALCLIAMVGAVCILGDTITESLTFDFVLTKAVGIAAAYAFFRLFVHWAKHRKIDGLLRIVFND